MGRFQGKRILITGGTSGMGLAGALRIISEGGQVAVTGLSAERLENARNLLPAAKLISANCRQPLADGGCLTAYG